MQLKNRFRATLAAHAQFLRVSYDSSAIHGIFYQTFGGTQFTHGVYDNSVSGAAYQFGHTELLTSLILRVWDHHTAQPSLDTCFDTSIFYIPEA